VISSAAAVMLAVFVAFALHGVLLVRMLGFALAVAVAIDATLVRLAMGPAILALAGRWNWWPGLGSSEAARAEAEPRGLVNAR
jgi:putative drug exporter of the RND superfamily